MFSMVDAAERFDVLHVHSPFSTLAASVETGPPTVHTLHGSFVPELTRLYSLVAHRVWFVAISEAPDDDAAAKVALAIGSAGNVTTETLRAFTEDEYRAIVAALP